MKKPSKRNYPDAIHEAMDIPAYTKPPMDDGSGPMKKKEKKNKHEKKESKKFERKEKRLGSEPEYQ